MESNNKIEDYTPILEATFGKIGSPEWQESIEEAKNVYTGQLIIEACHDDDQT